MNDYVTKSRLLTEARRLFADQGFRGTSVRDITSAARANLGAITYHFGSKDALYAATLETVFGDLAACVEQAARGPGSPLDRLEAVTRALFAFFRRTPEAPQLLLHQLAGTSKLPAVAAPFVRRNLAAIVGVVTEGIADGSVRAVEPTLVAFTIVSQAIWFAVVGYQIPATVGLDASADDFATDVEAHVVEVVTRFLVSEG